MSLVLTLREDIPLPSPTIHQISDKSQAAAFAPGAARRNRMSYEKCGWLLGLGACALLFEMAPLSVHQLRLDVDPNTAGAIALLSSGFVGFWHMYQRQRASARSRQ
jgi:hypothetical protein